MFLLCAYRKGGKSSRPDGFHPSVESSYNVGPHVAIEKIRGEAPGRYRRLHSGMGLPGLTLLYP